MSDTSSPLLSRPPFSGLKDTPVAASPSKSEAPEILRSSGPTVGRFDAEHIVQAAGVAIFHVRTERVVLVWHERDRYWFLPKGRKDAGEGIWEAAMREGFEESGYRNRLLPLPIRTLQPDPSGCSSASNPWIIEPVWTQLMPVSKRYQYLLFWFIAETLPPEDEAALGTGASNISSSIPNTDQPQAAFIAPTPYPDDLTLASRVAMEQDDYDPRHYEGTGVDEEEACYRAQLVDVSTAVRRLRGSTSGDVVRKGWELICLRRAFEAEMNR